MSDKSNDATPALPRCGHCGGETRMIGVYGKQLKCCVCHASGPRSFKFRDRVSGQSWEHAIALSETEAIAAYGKHAREEADALRDEIKRLEVIVARTKSTATRDDVIDKWVNGD